MADPEPAGAPPGFTTHNPLATEGPMTSTRRRWTSLLLALACLAPTTGAVARQAATVESSAPSLLRWSTSVWESAHRGDRDALDRLLEALPEPDPDHEAELARLRDAVELRRSNVDRSSATLAEARAEVESELLAHVEKEELTQALRSAIELQDLDVDFDGALARADVRSLVAWARDRVPEAEAAGDWLEAQELLFLLRTLHEETDATDAYIDYDRQLDAVNRRVSLLALYAPRHLYELREAMAVRNAEPELGPYNEASAVDWQERLDGVDHRTLKGALRIAAREHIETEGSRGWRILLDGGLDALLIMATTPGLDASFPSLGDPDKVGRWIAHLQRERRAIADLPDAELDSWTLQRLVDGLVRGNRDSVDLPTEVIYREFGDGAVHAFDEVFDDPYSEIVWPDKLRRFQQATEGNFIGVGVLIRHNEKREIMVVNPLEGTPAYFAGVKPNDLIMQVDGEATVGWSLNDAVDRITGPRGTKVVLGLQREGHEDLVEVPIERDRIKLRTVKGWWKEGLDDHGEPRWNWYIDPATRIAYIRLTQFTEDSYADLLGAWAEIAADGRPAGLILDLRYNPGGLLNSAVQISNLFVRNGLIVSGEDKYGRKAFPDYTADPAHADLFGVPTVVVINRGSASASEIVAGCMQAHGSAVIVGERSYGKGSVQTVHHVSDKARLKLTTHYYRLPPADGAERGRLVHKRPRSTDWGVNPDIEVRMTSAQVIDSLELRQDADILPQEVVADDAEPRPHVSELLTKGLDPQLETAVLILQARALGAPDRDERHARK